MLSVKLIAHLSALIRTTKADDRLITSIIKPHIKTIETKQKRIIKTIKPKLNIHINTETIIKA